LPCLTCRIAPERKEPIHIDEEIDLEQWKKALLYDKATVDDLIQKLLIDFNIEPSMSNIRWFYRQIEDMLSDYERQSDIQLQDQTLSMLLFSIVMGLAIPIRRAHYQTQQISR
jgi:hypothetical protein